MYSSLVRSIRFRSRAACVFCGFALDVLPQQVADTHINAGLLQRGSALLPCAGLL